MKHIEDCTCHCHTNTNMKHVTPCCKKCEKCGRNIKFHFSEQHEKDCVGNPIIEGVIRALKKEGQ